MKKIILLISVMSVLAGLFPAKAQQIPQFSQYMFNGLYINPAYAGYKENMYAHLIYRNQWVGIKGAPTTTMLSIDGKIAGGSNLGLVYANDQIGPFSTNSVMLSYAFRFNTGESSRLSFGLTGGALHYGIDKSKVDDDRLLATTENEWRPGVDVGVYFDMPHFYAGFSVMSLVPNKSDIKSSLLVMRTDPGYYLTLGGMIPLTQSLALMPSTLLKTDFKSPITFDINAMLMIVNRFWIGASYRTGIIILDNPDFNNTEQYDAIALIAEAFITERIRLGVAYDFDLNHLANSYNGTFEVSLGYYLTGAKRKYSTPRYF
jgi:type IX secretion system PorP/SprF family membrane protein